MCSSALHNIFCTVRVDKLCELQSVSSGSADANSELETLLLHIAREFEVCRYKLIRCPFIIIEDSSLYKYTCTRTHRKTSGRICVWCVLPVPKTVFSCHVDTNIPAANVLQRCVTKCCPSVLYAGLQWRNL